MTDDVDILVIGAGQAGLAAGYWLRERRVKFAIVDAGARVGDSWRNRYDTLTLFTPRGLSRLPGVVLEGDQEGYASREEFADYLERYASKLDLPVRSRAGVIRLTWGGKFHAGLQDGTEISARGVIDTTGAFQTPVVSELRSGFGAGVVQLDATTYRNPNDAAAGVVLVVGDGASGRDIAMDLAQTHAVTLATGKPRRLFPERILGRNTWWWLHRTGLLYSRATSMVGRLMRSADPFPDRGRSLPALRAAGITVRPRLSAANGSGVFFKDGSSGQFGTVIWAIGYREDRSWVAREAEKGLFLLGRPWQRNRASALIAGAGRDAELVVSAALQST